MNHANILCKSFFFICGITESVSMSRVESKDCAKGFISVLTAEWRDVSDGGR